MIYFFPIVGSGRTYPDSKGMPFPGLEEATKFAARIARELAAQGETYRGYAVCVTDTEQKEIARLSVEY